jgi:hypothetical protein
MFVVGHHQRRNIVTDEAAKGGQGSDCVMESMGNACNGQDIVQGLWQPEPV